LSRARFLIDVALARFARHSYGPHRQHRADLHLPDGTGPFPVAITIHGGYWRAKFSRWVMRPMARDLTRRGYAVWNIEYRRMGRGQGGGWPQTFDDVAAAIDHLATMDDERLDLDRGVVLIGHSAGGQLALWAASRHDTSVPIARVAALAPVTQMAHADAAHELLGGSPAEVPERFAAVDPIRLVQERGPSPFLRVLVVHGAGDETIPLRRSREYAEAARAAGADVELVEPNPGGHRDYVFPGSRAWRVAVDWILAA
jgi:acetyl esterase/lipase